MPPKKDKTPAVASTDAQTTATETTEAPTGNLATPQPQEESSLVHLLLQQLAAAEERRQTDREDDRAQQHALTAALLSTSAVATTPRPDPIALSPPPRQPTPRPPVALACDISLKCFKAWRATWTDYATVTRLSDLPLEHQQAHFRTCLTPEMRAMLTHVIGIETEEATTVESTLDNIAAHLRGQQSVAVDRVAFVERLQREGESFDEFYIALKELADEADLCQKCLHPRLVTRIMSGIRDPEIRKRLLGQHPFPDLANVLATCRSMESAYRDNSEFQICTTTTVMVAWFSLTPSSSLRTNEVFQIATTTVYTAGLLWRCRLTEFHQYYNICPSVVYQAGAACQFNYNKCCLAAQTNQRRTK